MGPHQFSERLKAVPKDSGVYLMRDKGDSVLYVGKATNLRSRIASYFVEKAGLSPKIRRLVTRITDFDFIVTESESEALILECNLIKHHQPHYNARLKDDKSYPFIKIDLSEDFPQIYISRNVRKDGARYFGPFASSGSVRRTLNLLKKLFPYRSCTKIITGTDPRPCLDFHINRCVGPCIGAVNQEEYGQIIDQVSLFLDGKTNRVTKSIKKRMLEASDELEYEKAAVLRDQLNAIEKVHEGQKVLHLSRDNIDVIATAPNVRNAWVEVFFIRQGKLIGRDHFVMNGTQDDQPGMILSAFVKQFYDITPYIPPRILIEHSLEDSETVSKWLSEKRQGKVKIEVPIRGEKRRLVAMVAENAVQAVEQLKVSTLTGRDNLEKAMLELQENLNMPVAPRRIECYDISNTQGTNPVGSMVVFENGKTKSSDYRRFKIKSVSGVDDYSMMHEMLTRRFTRMIETSGDTTNRNNIDRGFSKNHQSWQTVPDLVLIDGGKGHLGVAIQVFLELGIKYVSLASIAKENEELHIPQMQDPIKLPRTSEALFLVQRVRDEAHRFAITYHRQRRSKNSTASAIDLVPGIGVKRRRMLLRTFGSVPAIREASLQEIGSVPGMTMRLARQIKEYL